MEVVMIQKTTITVLTFLMAALWPVATPAATPGEAQLKLLPKVLVIRAEVDAAGHDISAEAFALDSSKAITNDKLAAEVADKLDRRNGTEVVAGQVQGAPAAVREVLPGTGRASNAIYARWGWYNGYYPYYGIYGYGYRPYYGYYGYRYPSYYGYYYGGYRYPYSYYNYSYYRYPYRYSYYYNPYYYPRF
jgi:hypothetical protein